jgi:hypothetical protein
MVQFALDMSPVHQVLLEESVLGWKEYELEVVRDTKDNCDHHLLDREPRSDGRPHRRLDHRRAGDDAHRQGVPAHARRLDRDHARDRRDHRRLQRAVRRRPGHRPAAGHRDEPAGVAQLGAGVEGHRLPDRQDRGEAGHRLHARRAEERHHPHDAGVVRADDRLRRRQVAAVRVREVPGRAHHARPADEVGRRGDGDRSHLPRGAGQGDPLARDRPRRVRRAARRAGRRPAGPRARDGGARSRAAVPARPRVSARAVARAGPRADPHRPVVPAPDPRDGDGRAGDRRRRRAGRDRAGGAAPLQARRRVGPPASPR